MSAADMVQILGWAFVAVGSAFTGVLVWAALGIFTRLEKLETTVSMESKRFLEMFHGLDKRVLWLESMEHRDVRPRPFEQLL